MYGGNRAKGRVAEDGAADLERRLVTLDNRSIRILTRLGNGNLSLGVRRAADMADTYGREIDFISGGTSPR